MCCEQKIWHHFINWAHTLSGISEDGQWLKWSLMTDGSIRSSGQPGKTELRVCEILDSWPNISEVSNKERDREADGGFKNGLQIIILAKKSKTKQTQTILFISASSSFLF